MADSLLENYNPLYDVHLRQYFALPHMQKHLRRMGLLDSNGVPVAPNGNVESEMYARHHAMMDMMLRNRERVLMQLADLQKKYDAAEKVEIYRRVRSGVTNPDEFRRTHLSRSLSRPPRSIAQAKAKSNRRRHSSTNMEDTEVIKRIENTYEQPHTAPVNVKNTYDRLAANAFKYQFLHKLDDSTLLNYKDSLQKQLQRLQRFRDVSFGPHNVARHQPSLQNSWFFRRRSLKALKNGGDQPRRRQNKSQSPRRFADRQTSKPKKSPQKQPKAHAARAIEKAPTKPPRAPAEKPPSPAIQKEEPASPAEPEQSGFLGKIAAGAAAAASAVGGAVVAGLVGADEPEPPKERTPSPQPMDVGSDQEVEPEPEHVLHKRQATPPQEPEPEAEPEHESAELHEDQHYEVQHDEPTHEDFEQEEEHFHAQSPELDRSATEQTMEHEPHMTDEHAAIERESIHHEETMYEPETFASHQPQPEADEYSDHAEEEPVRLATHDSMMQSVYQQEIAEPEPVHEVVHRSPSPPVQAKTPSPPASVHERSPSPPVSVHDKSPSPPVSVHEQRVSPPAEAQFDDHFDTQSQRSAATHDEEAAAHPEFEGTRDDEPALEHHETDVLHAQPLEAAENFEVTGSAPAFDHEYAEQEPEHDHTSMHESVYEAGHEAPEAGVPEHEYEHESVEAKSVHEFAPSEEHKTIESHHEHVSEALAHEYEPEQQEEEVVSAHAEHFEHHEPQPEHEDLHAEDEGAHYHHEEADVMAQSLYQPPQESPTHFESHESEISYEAPDRHSVHDEAMHEREPSPPQHFEAPSESPALHEPTEREPSEPENHHVETESVQSFRDEHDQLHHEFEETVHDQSEHFDPSMEQSMHQEEQHFGQMPSQPEHEENDFGRAMTETEFQHETAYAHDYGQHENETESEHRQEAASEHSYRSEEHEPISQHELHEMSQSVYGNVELERDSDECGSQSSLHGESDPHHEYESHTAAHADASDVELEREKRSGAPSPEAPIGSEPAFASEPPHDTDDLNPPATGRSLQSFQQHEAEVAAEIEHESQQSSAHGHAHKLLERDHGHLAAQPSIEITAASAPPTPKSPFDNDEPAHAPPSTQTSHHVDTFVVEHDDQTFTSDEETTEHTSLLSNGNGNGTHVHAEEEDDDEDTGSVILHGKHAAGDRSDDELSETGAGHL